ncbi:MAG: type I DNA topoisomerase [Methylotenera sp.]|nr:type I DNA topoisomerase [Oligoflexia bacterium]
MAKAKKALVIVESPSKAKTIQKYLGRDYIVKASVGHIKDLPKSKLGVDTENGFKPDYQVIPAKAKIIEELKKFAKSVPELYLATDPDREGEAIAYHIHEELKAKGKIVHRVLFNSITKAAILEAMSKPEKLNMDKFHAQQARRILDRLVGYKISPILWDKVRRGLSAGRVQSVALRLVVDRETEIKAFKSEEYWSLEGIFSKDGIDFSAKHFKTNGKDPEVTNKAAMDQLLISLKGAEWKISSIEQKERTRKAQPPFITSRLQQEGSRKLGFSAKKTMALAQRLYEGMDLGEMGTNGLITYMRTDSVRIEPVAMDACRDYIKERYGKEYLSAEPNIYKTKKSAQDAHEAIRPTSMEYTPERVQPFLEKDEFRLYQLIWNRFISCQMTQAIYDQTAVDIITKDKAGNAQNFRATGSVMKFPGFTKVYTEGQDAADRQKAEKAGQTLSDDEAVGADTDRVLTLPKIKIGDVVAAKEFTPAQHFTQPPPRYTDASLIRDLEEKGIGRPSTYATILSNIQDRDYVEKRESRYYPSELGIVVTELLVLSFPVYLNSEFTADMETQLDDIEDGKADWKKTLGKFWKPFEKNLEAAKIQMKDVKRTEIPTDVKCERCTHTMLIKFGKMGSFLACSNYPECKNTQDFRKDDNGKIEIVPKELTDKICEKCQSGMVVKRGKFGSFLACSDYPNCKYTQPITIGVHCPTCATGEIAQKQSKYRRLFYSCNKWPECNFACWDKPVAKPCPDCKSPILTEKVTKKMGFFHKCPNKECGYIEIIDPSGGQPVAEPSEGSSGSGSEEKSEVA